MSHAVPPSDEGLTPPQPGQTPAVPDTHPDAPQPIPPSKRSDRALIEDALNHVAPKSGSASADPAAAANAGTFTGYTILREIHRGGQGVVYQALQLATKRKVAIKVIHGGPFTGSQGRARFDREVQILGQLNHRNIVAIHDSGVTSDGSFFYVMDYISGKSLDEVLRSSSNPPSIDETLTLFIKICDAVNAAHLKGVIHRDLKPANIRIDQNGEPIVVDFGLAKLTTADFADKEQGPNLMTLTGQFVGSLPWASPEQAQGTPNAIDVRTDVYSLGVLLYELLTGTTPFTGKELRSAAFGELQRIIREVEPPKPSTRISVNTDTIASVAAKRHTEP
ncbi:MAG: serine/threonine-protein kinase, partial [Planctomycetota bacterium]|nr:serine/threonine-protein kinase [Planctomycetota bacterium]